MATFYGRTNVVTSAGVQRGSTLLNLADRRTGVVSGNTETVRMFAVNDTATEGFCVLNPDIAGNVRGRITLRSGSRNGNSYGEYDPREEEVKDVPLGGTLEVCLRPGSFVELVMDVNWAPYAPGVGTPILRVQASTGGVLDYDNRNTPGGTLGAPAGAPGGMGGAAMT